MYKAILFDLDGTLTESGEGITKCVQYALEQRAKQWNTTESVILLLEYLRIVHTRGWKRCFRN